MDIAGVGFKEKNAEVVYHLFPNKRIAGVKVQLAENESLRTVTAL